MTMKVAAARSHVLSWCVATLAVGVGCGESPDAATSVAATSPQVDDAAVRECDITEEGRPQACSCGATTGTRVCLSGEFAPCRCSPVDAGAASNAGTLCKAGFYSGEFSGKYKPGAFGLGLFMSFFEVDITGAPAGGYPALSLTLEETMTQGGGEFATFGVENGCMIGSAKAGGTNNPFVARLTGALDCGTGLFNGTITGNYNLVQSGITFNFTGPLTAQFTPPQARLSDGVWNVQEPPALTGEASGGGGGTWSATWPWASAPTGASDPCAALDGADAGSAPVSDASQP